MASPSTESIQESIDADTGETFNHREEREFLPHLTLGRVTAQGRDARMVGEAVQRASAPRLGGWRVREIELIRSELMQQGARYATLATCAISG